MVDYYIRCGPFGSHFNLGRVNMSIIDKLYDEGAWSAFLNHKCENEFISKREKRKIEKFIKEKKYLPIVEKIHTGVPFSSPRLAVLNKKYSKKKRSVFIFADEENITLKMIGYLLYEYDLLFSPNLYSFRQNMTAKLALEALLRKNRGSHMYSYKADIHDYFNSVTKEKVVSLLYKYIPDDKPLITFIEALLSDEYAFFRGERIKVKKGIMAGMPISGFLANLYLLELDKYFYERNIPYARYSDDIIVFANTEAELSSYELTIKAFLKEYNLTINERKEFHTPPYERWEFLGFSINRSSVDISDASFDKIKAKLRRKARAILRWKDKTDATDEWAIRAYIKHFNKKFFHNDKENELTWCKWYFPAINTTRRIKEIDEYMVSCIRYIATGKHTKANYNLRYDKIKALGYISLVNAYYRFKRGKDFPLGDVNLSEIEANNEN